MGPVYGSASFILAFSVKPSTNKCCVSRTNCKRRVIEVNRKALGEEGEELAAQKLEESGFQIRDRNWRTPEGELDIVAQEGDVIVFVEVKARRSRLYGLPEEAITRKKRAHLLKAALAYLEAHNLQDANWRFDLVAIEWSFTGELIRCEHFIDIIEADPGEYV
jgi:putative endonuclease